MGLRDQLLHHHIQHGAGSKGQHPGHQRLDASCDEHHQNAEDQLHNAGEAAHQEGLHGGNALLPQGQGDRGPLGEVLDAHAQGQRHGSGHGGAVPPMLSGHGKGEADSHPLGDVVERHRQHHEGGPLPGAVGTLGLFFPKMQMGHHVVHQQQEYNTQNKASGRRDQPSTAGGLRFLDGGDQQTPDRGGGHHAGSKAEKDALSGGIDVLAKEKDQGGAEGCHQEREAGSGGCPQNR